MVGKKNTHCQTENLASVLDSSWCPEFCIYHELWMSKCIDTKLCLRDGHARKDQQGIIIKKKMQK